MELTGKPTILCISTYEKGQAFLREAARQGTNVILLTTEKLAEADWPREAITLLPTMTQEMPAELVVESICRIARGTRIDRIVALDEFDLETAALAREHMRLPGMGQTLTRHFRDKLAMRVRAKQCGVAVPEFTGVFHYDDLRSFMGSVPGPWLLKPRTNASAIGIRKIEEPETLWRTLDELGDLQSHYVMERFLPGDVYHVEGISWNNDVLFAAPHRYGQPPMQTMHQGGVFTTRSLRRGSEDARAILELHRHVLSALGMCSGVTHTEFIKAKADGRFYFLETAARVGGAYIAETVEFARGINPWVEWARLEVAALRGDPYVLPKVECGYSGSVICLARQETPDTVGYTDPEIVLRLHKHHHAGLIVRSESVDGAGRGAGGWLCEPVSGRFLRGGTCAGPADRLNYPDLGSAGEGRTWRDAPNPSQPGLRVTVLFCGGNQGGGTGGHGESAGARTQDQRLKRAMLYQLSYALTPYIHGSIFRGARKAGNRSLPEQLRCVCKEEVTSLDRAGRVMRSPLVTACGRLAELWDFPGMTRIRLFRDGNQEDNPTLFQER